MSVIPWDLINKYATQFNVDPVLLAAIGKHETNFDSDKGFHMGYGFYSPTNYDNRFAGLENQIKFAAQKMRRWGMSPGSVTKDRLAAGNAGLYPSGIYATDKNWPNAVYNHYVKLSGIPTIPAQPGLEKSIQDLNRKYGSAETVPRPSGWIETPIYFLTLTGVAVVALIALYKSAGGTNPVQVVSKIAKEG